MNRLTVSLLAALDAVIALGVGVAIPLAPLTVMWGLQSGLAGDWLPYWHGAADIWLLGHGVDVTFTLDAATAASLGMAAQPVFTVTIAVLGFALLTAGMGVRTGRRAWGTAHPVTAVAAGALTFAVLSTAVTLSAHSGPAVPSLLQGALLPAGAFALGMLVGLVAAEVQDRSSGTGAGAVGGGVAGGLPWPVDGWSPAVRAVLAAALRGGVAASLLLVSAAGIALTLTLAFGYGRVIGLYETLQPGALGATAITLAQLALVPNAVIWTASWLAGPGFALGTGSSIDVTQTTVGPLPDVPLLGALPQHDPAFGLVAVIVPVLCGAIAGFLTRLRLDSLRLDGMKAGRAGVQWGVLSLSFVVVGSAIVAGAVFGLLAWWSSGSVGPGRLQDAGPNGLLLAGAVAAEVLVGGAIGIAVRRQPSESAEPVERIALRERRARDEFGGFGDRSATGLGETAPISRTKTEPVRGSRPGPAERPPAEPTREPVTEPVPVVVVAPPEPPATETPEPAPRPRLARPAGPRVPTPRGRLPRL